MNMAKLTVITRQRLFGHKPGSVIVVDDSTIVRGLLARGRLDLVDPPSLEILDGKSSSTPSTDSELPDESKRPSGSGSRKTSRKRTESSEGSGSGGSDGEPSEVVEDRQDDTEGKAYRSSYS